MSAPRSEPARAAPEAPCAPLLVVLLGPTASGKTALSLSLAERFNGEIVSCDSVAVYRGLDTGSAKPTAAERARAPHHLLDIYPPDAYATAGGYARLARRVIAEITARGRLPIVTGGSGLYLRALLDGLFAGPERSESLRDRLRKSSQRHGALWLHRVLERFDPAAARRIHPNDAPKLIRAIEVSLAAHEPMTEVWQSGRNRLGGYRILRIGINPERQALYARINERVRRMFASGLIEETRSLAVRYGSVRTLDSPGYRQSLSVLRGEISPDEAILSTAQSHRNYAKRQLTWFRREPDVHWICGFGDAVDVERQASDWIRSALARPRSDGSPAAAFKTA